MAATKKRMPPEVTLDTDTVILCTRISVLLD